MNRIFYPSELLHWSSIQWKSTENTVSRIQHRIAKATLEGDQRKIRNLQRLIVKSFSARLNAVRRVAQENKDKNTPGIDGDLWTTPKSKIKAALSLGKKMKTKPLCRIYISQRYNSDRPLGIPTMTDRAKQALWNFALNPIVDTLSDSTSCRFSPYTSYWNIHSQIKVILSCKKSPKWVLTANIRKSFNTINHEWLLKNTPMENKIINSWLKFGFIKSSEELHDTFAGTLYNHAFNGLKHLIKAKFFRYQNKGVSNKSSYSSGINIIRYADDFIVTSQSSRQLKRAIIIISNFLKPRGLELQPEKTKIVNIHNGFHFLGWTFKKSKNKRLLCNISKETIKDHKITIRRIVKNSKNKSTSDLINQLNLVIQGWCNYHCRATNIWSVWNHTNQYLYRLLWKWVRKRHPRKSHFWLYDYYWKIIDGRRTFVTSESHEKFKYKLVSYCIKQQKIQPISKTLKMYIPD